ncbi:MAG: DNA-binding domain-containing protein [Polyangiaceae bacterium]
MSHLRDLQTFFGAVVRRESSFVDDAQAARHATGNSRLGPAAQFEIYREQFWLRHVGSLREDYGTLVHRLGEDGFDDLARRYLAGHPPSDWSLRDLGKNVPTFVRSNAPWMADPFLADLAAFEWAFMEAFDAAEVPPFDPRSIEGATEDDWDRARLAFHPTFRLVRTSHPVRNYREALRRGEVPVAPPPADTATAVWRTKEGLVTCDVELLAAKLLTRLLEGEGLSDACEAVAKDSQATDTDALSEKVSAWFQEWTGRGWLVGVRFDAR